MKDDELIKQLTEALIRDESLNRVAAYLKEKEDKMNCPVYVKPTAAQVKWNQMSNYEQEMCMNVFENWKKVREEEFIKLAQWDREKDFDQELYARMGLFAGRQYHEPKP